MSQRRPPILLRPIALAVGLALGAGTASAQVENGSFETGDFTGWTTTDVGTPLVPLQVSPAGLDNAILPLESEPTDGEFSAVTGFDGDGPGLITLAQDVTLPNSASVLLLDFSTEWNLVDFGTSTIDRTVSVVVEPAGGGTPLQTLEVLRVPFATAGSLLDVTALVNLKAYAGETVSLKFQLDVPEPFSGPALFDLDHVRLAGKKVAAEDAASLKVHLVMAQQAKDTIKLVLEAPVDKGFAPEGQTVTISVGDVEAVFELDAAGKSVTDAGSLKVKPVPGNSLLQKLTMTLKAGDFLSGLQTAGLLNVDTPAGGITALIPVSVSMDGIDTQRSILVVYKAQEDGVGNASGKTSSEALAAKLNIQLDFDTADNDSITLKTAALVPPGFLPGGQEITVSIGSFSRVFTLDPNGQAEEGGDSITLKRDPKNPGRQSVSFKCKDRDAHTALAADGLLDADVPKPGDALLLPVTVDLADLNTRVIVPVTYTAKAGLSGKAAGKF